MERESQSTRTRLIKHIEPTIWRANFYRFCQLLEKVSPQSPPLGTTDDIKDDPLRFRPWPGMGFPAGELRTVEQHSTKPELPLTVRTNFLGLYGIDSPLPTSYLDDIAQGVDGTEVLTEFLDIFNHRIITQYYRIWRKYAYPATFEAGGTDATSQCLLGLIGLGIPGCAERIATPISRFLALLSTMRLPTRNSEGVKALISLLAPNTQAVINEYDIVKVPVDERTSLARHQRVSLATRPTLGKTAKDTTSRILISLTTYHPQEAQGWLPGGHLYTDFLVLLRVYLGYRSDACLKLTVPISILPEPRLQKTSRIQLGRTGLLGLKDGKLSDNRQFLTVNLGRYHGIKHAERPEAEQGGYRFA
ncbi:type VI secretion system baseplate subunit TssG [Proteus mirabilis]|uniref:type VI secretion system baseplate subunit TssG n=1 Tax=Proteus mirabilis TaxID=584 RepID=UPI00235FDD25|nr:type VI secretion system baseplate subunit TssG [Proteus mirabilis]MDC9768168.1 type VI secretion system baseplate subunit TssG [Proteus mirabilis]